MIPTKVSGLFFVEILDRYKVNRHLAGYPMFTVTLMRCSGGSGVALNNTLLALLVKIHFKKHLTLAFGITQAGSCIGAFFTPPLLLWIFRNYGTSGGFLIIGAMVLNTLPIVMIINILSPDRTSSKSGNSVKSKECTKGQSGTDVTKTVSYSEGEDSDKTYITGNENEKDVKTREENVVPEIQNSPESEDLTSLILNRYKCDHAEVVTDGTNSKSKGPSNEFNFCSISGKAEGSETGKEAMVLDEWEIISENKPKTITHEKEDKVDIDRNINEFRNYSKGESIPLVDIRRNTTANISDETLQPSTDHTYSKSKCKIKAEINNKNILGNVNDYDHSKDSNSDALPSTSVKNISASRSSEYSAKTQLQLMTETEEVIPPFLSPFNPISSEVTLPCNQEINHKEILKTDKQHSQRAKNANRSLRIFLDVTFWIVVITQSLHVFILIVFWTTMIDFSRDKNIDRSMEVYLLMVLPIAEIIGRLGLGWITDSNYVTRINFSILSFIIMGCSCSLMAWAREFYIVIISIFLFGIISSGLITMLPMIVFEFFDSTKHTMGQASRYCLFGPLSFLNGPLIGYFRDTVGSYSWLYHTLAVVSVACAALSALIPICNIEDCAQLLSMELDYCCFLELFNNYFFMRHRLDIYRQTGPLVGYFAERFGMNGVMILGSILSAAGISACFFAEDIAVVIVLLGVLHGLGVAFLNIFLPMIVKIHFKKHLTLAFGVTQAGACIGAFFAPALLLWIFRNYGTSGGFLIIGAMVLNSLPIVMIINILSPDRTSSKLGNSAKSKEFTKGQLETALTTTVHFGTTEVEDNALTDITDGKEEKVLKVREENIISKIQNSPENEDVASLVLNSPKCDHAEVVTDGTDAKALGSLSDFNMCRISAENAESETGKKGMELLLDKLGKASEMKQQKQNHKEEIKITTDKKINEFQNYIKEEFIPLVDIRTKPIKKDCEENVQQPTDYTYSKKRFKYKAEVSNKDTQEQILKSANDRDRVKDSNIHTPPCNFVNNISCGSLTFPTKTQLQPVTETEEIISPALKVFNPKSSEPMLPSNQQFHQSEVLQIDEQRSTRATNANKSLKIFLDVTFWIVIITQSLHRIFQRHSGILLLAVSHNCSGVGGLCSSLCLDPCACQDQRREKENEENKLKMSFKKTNIYTSPR
ncbi:hypothetical protein HNY73_003186 [Argiope bruennichi]|uniref:Uncharacterized protein n=1 Tax=Argiope bruennichi TaxID=94029 RepID=A0A8T0G260_ARGBR|nr:hypothetical protein HNY73_003186 [Argiope bruennichi]